VNQQLDVVGDRMQYRDNRYFERWRSFRRRCSGTRRRIWDDEDGTDRPNLRVTLFENAVMFRSVMMRTAMRFGVTMDRGAMMAGVIPPCVDVHRRGEGNPPDSRRQRQPGKPRQGHDGRDPKPSKNRPQLKSV
jgi:hypothetical protein